MTSLLDDANALLKLKQGGDLGKLEHIKKNFDDLEQIKWHDENILLEIRK